MLSCPNIGKFSKIPVEKEGGLDSFVSQDFCCTVKSMKDGLEFLCVCVCVCVCACCQHCYPRGYSVLKTNHFHSCNIPNSVDDLCVFVLHDCSPKELSLSHLLLQQSPTFWLSGTSFVEDNISTHWGGGGGFRMIEVHYLYCALYFYYYCISYALGHQALDPRGWGPPFHSFHLFIHWLPQQWFGFYLLWLPV